MSAPKDLDELQLRRIIVKYKFNLESLMIAKSYYYMRASSIVYVYCPLLLKIK